MPTAPQKQTLYDRLGGIYSIAVVVDDFIDRIMVDDRLNANPAVNEAHHKVPPAGFKYLVTQNGRMGYRGTTEIYRTVNARITSAPEHHAEGMGGVYG